MFFEILRLLANVMMIVDFLLIIVCFKSKNNTVLGIH